MTVPTNEAQRAADRRTALKRIIQDNFDSYGQAADRLRMSESWFKSRLSVTDPEPISDLATDALRLRLQELGIAHDDFR